MSDTRKREYIDYDNWYKEQQRYQVLREIWTSVYGDDYPEDADPNSFVTVTDLNRITTHLDVNQSDTIADIGCGRGGPGLWVAKQTGAQLIGIDIASSAVQFATSQVPGTPYENRVRFQQGEFSATGLPDHSMDGVMSVDALLFVPARFSACYEMRRILKPGRLFVFTTWEIRKPSVWFRLDPILDYRPLLELSGFRVELYEETPGWERCMREIGEGILSRMGELIEQMGKEEAEGWRGWTTTRLPELSDNRRVLVAARAI